MPEIELNYNCQLEIDITPLGASRMWAAIKKGFSNLAEALNEVLFQAAFFGDEGWGSSEVTGGQYTVTLTGVRFFNDQAQDYIFSDAVRLNFGVARKTTLRITRQNEAILEWGITLVNITASGGDANKPDAISVVIHGNGKPRILTGVYLDPLKVVSVAGSESGETAIYVNPAVESGHSYKYKTAASVDLPAFDAVLTTGWTAWDGSAEITAVTGDQIVIAEIETSSNKAKKGGIAEVTAA